MLIRAIPVATALCLALAGPALAQSQLERMEVLSERTSALMNEALIAQMPALEGNLPSPEWDDEMRAAFSCVLDGYVDASSPAEIDAMFDEMEARLETMTAEELMADESPMMEQDLPGSMTEEQGIALMTSCGVMDVMMARMAESGAMTIMMQGQ